MVKLYRWACLLLITCMTCRAQVCSGRCALTSLISDLRVHHDQILTDQTLYMQETPLTLQQALEGQLAVSGTVSAINAGCNVHDSAITATANNLPAGFLSATVYCSLVLPQSIQSWESLLQVKC